MERAEKQSVKKELKTIHKVMAELLAGKGIYIKVDDLSTQWHRNIIIEPYNYKGDGLDGMQIIYEDGIYEVSQYQAGEKQNELHIYLETKSFRVALKNMLKGNSNRPKPIKIWD